MRETLVDFYRNLRDKHGWKSVARFLEVLPVVEAEIKKKKLTAFTSHEVLRITPHPKYPEWFEDDLLSIIPDRSGSARVVYQSKESPSRDFDGLCKAAPLVAYDALLPAIAPYLEALARKKKA